MGDTPLVYIYLGVVAVVGLYALVRVYFGLNRTRIARLRRLADKRRFEAIPTDTPVDDPTTVARNRAYEAIDKQFTVTRRILVPLVVAMTGAAMALPFLDQVPATIVSIVVTAITVLAGVAARPFLENAIAGLVISSSRLINLGDTVKIADFYGTVEDITATHTTIKLWDWRRYVVPNSQMLQSNFLNYSLFDRFIWASVEIWVAYESDVDQVQDIAIEVAGESAYFAGTEEPDFWVLGLDKDGVRCMVAAWANLPSEAWMLTHDIRIGLARAFREEGIRAHVRHHDFRGPMPAPRPASEPPSAPE